MKQYPHLISNTHWATPSSLPFILHDSGQTQGPWRSGASHQALIIVRARVSCRKSKQVQRTEGVSNIVGTTQMSETLKTQHTCLVGNNIPTVSCLGECTLLAMKMQVEMFWTRTYTNWLFLQVILI